MTSPIRKAVQGNHLHLTEAQQSALECAWLDNDVAIVRDAWNGGSRLDVSEETRETLWSALNTLSNSEDAMAEEYRDCDRELRNFANRAAKSLSVLASNVLLRKGWKS